MTIDQKVDQLASKVGGRHTLDLQFFADPEPPAPPAPPDPQGGQAPPDPTPPTPPAPEETFTQEQVTAITAREAKKAQANVLEQLGIDNVDNAKEGIKQLKAWQDSQKTEAQKQADALKAAQAEKDSLSNKATLLEAQLGAVKAGVNADSVEDVVTLAQPLVGEGVDMDAAIKKVIEKYPHFTGEKPGNEKPNFTTGDYKKQPQNEADKWMQAFSAGLPQKNQGGK